MPSKEWLLFQLSCEMSAQVLEMLVYFVLQIDRKEKTTPLNFSKRCTIHLMIHSPIDYSTNNLPHFFCAFLNRKKKQKALKTEYYPFTGFFHKWFLQDRKVTHVLTQYIKSLSRKRLWGREGKCKGIPFTLKNIGMSGPPSHNKSQFIVFKMCPFSYHIFPT